MRTRQGIRTLGGFDLRLQPDTPRAVRSALLEWGMVVVTNVWSPGAPPSKEEALADARFSGMVRVRGDGGRYLSGPSTSVLLGDEQGKSGWSSNVPTAFAGASNIDLDLVIERLLGIEAPLSGHAGHCNGLTLGQVKATTVRAVIIGQGEDARQFLDYLCFGAAGLTSVGPNVLFSTTHPDITWRVNPDLSLDVDDTTALWSSTPTVFIGRGVTAHDPDIRVMGATLDVIGADVEDWASDVVTLDDGGDLGEATVGVNPYVGPGGDPLTIRQYMEIEDGKGDDDAYASSQLAPVSTARREIAIQADEGVDVGRWVRPGDKVYLHDTDNDIVDLDNPLSIAGVQVFPEVVDIAAIEETSPPGVGVYYVALADSDTVYDLTEHLVYRPSTTTIELGAESRPLNVMPQARTINK